MGGRLSNSSIDIDQWVREHQSSLKIRGIKNKTQLKLRIINVEWSPLENEEYWWTILFLDSLELKQGQSFTTTIGTDVTITSGFLYGFHKKLELPLAQHFPPCIGDLVTHPIHVDLGSLRTNSVTKHRYRFPCDEQFEVNKIATFKCEVQLEEDVRFESSTKSGTYRSVDQVDAREVARARGFSFPRWTVEGKCVFHLGRNPSVQRKS